MAAIIFTKASLFGSFLMNQKRTVGQFHKINLSILLYTMIEVHNSVRVLYSQIIEFRDVLLIGVPISLSVEAFWTFGLSHTCLLVLNMSLCRRLECSLERQTQSIPHLCFPAQSHPFLYHSFLHLN